MNNPDCPSPRLGSTLPRESKVHHAMVPIMRMTSCFLIMVFMFSSLLYGQEGAVIPDAPSRFHLFLLAGQSNMAGRGKVEPQDLEPHPRVRMLDKAGNWVPAIDPLHFDKPKVVGVGVGKTFGIAYAEANPGITVGLIPCAAGGSPIAAWEPGGYHSQTKSHPYDDALQRMLPVLKQGTLKGILWHQGESDSKAGLSEVYEQNLHELVSRLRTDLKSPSVPFIAGQMGQFDQRPWNDHKRRVDAAHRALASAMPRTGFANSDGLKHRGDMVHFDSASYRELGRRMFQSYLSVTRRGREGVSESAVGGTE
jgi:hypothetical protein